MNRTHQYIGVKRACILSVVMDVYISPIFPLKCIFKILSKKIRKKT